MITEKQKRKINRRKKYIKERNILRNRPVSEKTKIRVKINKDLNKDVQPSLMSKFLNLFKKK